MKLTDSTIKAEIKNADKITIIRDSELKGLYVRHNPANGTTTYHVTADQPSYNHDRVKIGKRTINLTLGKALLPAGHPDRMTTAQARADAGTMKALILSAQSFTHGGKYYAAINPDQPHHEKPTAATLTLEQAMREYLAKHPCKTDKRNAEWKRETRNEFGRLLKRPIQFFSDEFVHKNYQPTHGTHKAYQHLSAVLRFLKRERKPRITIHPEVLDQIAVESMQYNSKVKTSEELTLKDHHMPFIWPEIDLLSPSEIFPDLFRFITYTGMRVIEAASLEWSRVDFTDRSFWIPDSKNGKPLYLPMSNQVYDLLEARKGQHSRFVFGSDRYADGHPHADTSSKTHTAFVKAVQKATGDTHVKATRKQFRKFARQMLVTKVGTNADLVDAIMNHSPRGVGASHYFNRSDVEPKREPMQTLADAIDALKDKE